MSLKHSYQIYSYCILAFLVFGVLSIFLYTTYLAGTVSTVPLVETIPESAMTKVSESTKVSVVGTIGHEASGTAHVVDIGDQVVLRYEDLNTVNGPDLFVYLSTDIKATDFINLGTFKSTQGNQNYEIPAGTDLEKYRYALVWCKRFGVLFNYAELPTNIMKTTIDVQKDTLQDGITTTGPQTALFANGCFWCVEHDLEKVEGVIGVVSGYAGGNTENPTYKNYHDGGHREVVEVTYDPQKVRYGNLVEHIIKHGDPTDAEGSFYDRGSYYAPALYYKDEAEKQTAMAIIEAVDALRVFEKPLPLAVLPSVTFWPAEEYHQDYAKKNPLRYNYYRAGSGRTAFIEKTWGSEVNTFTISNNVDKKTMTNTTSKTGYTQDSWNNFSKPTEEVLRQMLTPEQYSVTQEEGTERPRSHQYDKLYDEGIYVDVVSGEPLFFSKDKYDSGTGWPSFVKPISDEVVTLKVDKKLFSTRTEVRSRHADSHLGHVFDDGPKERGGKRYCMNGAALRFVPKADMEKEGYGYLLGEV